MVCLLHPVVNPEEAFRRWALSEEGAMFFICQRGETCILPNETFDTEGWNDMYRYMYRPLSGVHNEHMEPYYNRLRLIWFILMERVYANHSILDYEMEEFQMALRALRDADYEEREQYMNGADWDDVSLQLRGDIDLFCELFL